jgi:hypothetical protein
MIAIVCDAASHAGKVVRVAEFHRRMDNRLPPPIPNPEWGPADWVIEWGKLQGKNKPAADHQDLYSSASDHYERYRLECRLCGLCVVAVADKLVPLLMKAHEVGVSRIPLSVLAASIS